MIPKEKQTAYQRWEMPSFNNRHIVKEEPTEPALTHEEIEAQIKVRTEQAIQQGYAQGLIEGHAAGMAQSKTTILNDNATLLNLAGAFSKSLDLAENDFSMSILKLSLDIAHAILKKHLNLNPQAILTVVNEIANQLPSNINQVKMRLNPDDAQTVKIHLLNELTHINWLIIEDEHIYRGGCLIETAFKQIDARIETRWQRICESLGQTAEWVENRHEH
jgi:flagellar assembly protein FliH